MSEADSHEKEQPEVGGHALGAHDHASGGEHAHGGGHMGHMETVKRALQKKLGDQYDAPLAELKGANLARGKELFQKSCASCHGKTGVGDGPNAAAFASPPADLTDAHHARYYSDRGRLEIVRYGIEGTPMPGAMKELGEQGTLDVYAFARSLAGSPPAASEKSPAEPPKKKKGGHGHGNHPH